ncbi:MAG: hypothetical protein GXP35_12000 [Actinobacteria bacterium]|nr:hypothetical protein [Actinomycetota bacterium]
MWIRLRQIAIVAVDLHPVSIDLGEVLGLEPCYTDPAVARFGLKNMLWPVGSQFIEVVTPIAEGTAAGRYLDRRDGDGGYMVINQVDDIGPRRQRAAELGVRIAFDLHFPDAGHDGFQLHPADTGGSLFEMDQMLETGSTNTTDESDAWYPAGTNWSPYVRTNNVSAITAAELQSPDPERLARRWSEIAELELHTDKRGRLAMSLQNAEIRFVEALDGRGEGLGAIDLATTNRAAVVRTAAARGILTADNEVLIAGLRVNLQ